MDEVLRVASDEGIDARAAKGGTITLARTPVQLDRARAEVADARAWGLGPDRVRLLDADGKPVRNAALGFTAAVELSSDRLLRKQPVLSSVSTPLFRVGAWVVLAASLLAGADEVAVEQVLAYVREPVEPPAAKA